MWNNCDYQMKITLVDEEEEDVDIMDLHENPGVTISKVEDRPLKKYPDIKIPDIEIFPVPFSSEMNVRLHRGVTYEQFVCANIKLESCPSALENPLYEDVDDEQTEDIKIEILQEDPVRMAEVPPVNVCVVDDARPSCSNGNRPARMNAEDEAFVYNMFRKHFYIQVVPQFNERHAMVGQVFTVLRRMPKAPN